MQTKSTFLLSFCFIALLACNNQNTGASSTAKEMTNDSTKTTPSIKEEAVTYSADGTTFKSFVTYDENKKGPRPVVLIVPEWWGLTSYPRMRAKMLAELGYFAMAVDMYGEGKIADDPKAAQEAAGPFYGSPQLGKTRLDAALAKAKTFAQADSSQVVAIGYCFGGFNGFELCQAGRTGCRRG